MTRRISLFEFMPYGAPELLQGSKPHMARALTLGSVLWCALFATALAILAVVPKSAQVTYVPPVIPTFDVGPTPLEKEPTIVPPRAKIAPKQADQGVVVPVPETRNPPDIIDTPPSNYGHGSDSGTDDRPISVLAPPTETVGPPREIQEWEADVKPAEVTVVKPEYPEIAKEAGIEGMVYVRVAVGPNGHVLRAEVQKGVPLLNQAALEAARRWVFTPGFAAGHPVTVLVTIPFRFTLHPR